MAINASKPVTHARMTSEEKREMAHMLVERASLAVKTRPFLESELPDWKPEAGDCHANVDLWVKTHPGYNAVRGWLDISYVVVYPARKFAAHSLVSTENGCLFEITPGPDKNQCVFIRHPGSDKNFERFMTNENHVVECGSIGSELHDDAISLGSYDGTET